MKLKSITKGTRFVDDDLFVWLYQDTITIVTAAGYIDVKFLFVSEDYDDSLLLGYTQVDDALREQNDE